MIRGILFAIVLIPVLILGCSPKVPSTSSPTEVTSPSVAPQENQTAAPSTTQSSPPSASTATTTPSPTAPLNPPTEPPPPTRTTAPISTTPTQTRSLPPLDAFMKGITFAAWKSFDANWPGMYTPPGADQSLKDLAATGANWISIPVKVGQETIASTKIFLDSPATATNSELRRMIDLAHSLGIRVMLRPGISLSNDPGHWGGQIGTAFTSEDQWQEWFASYREFINHYATFSQEVGVDMLNIGWEYGSTTHREADWRRIVEEVRQRYKGPLTYSSLGLPAPEATPPHGEDARIKWWDAVDYIGVDVWPLLTNKNDPTVEELKAAWTNSGYLARLESLSEQLSKPIIFTEIGYPSFDGVNKLPAVLQPRAPVDLQEQVDCYQAAFEVCWGKPWLAGMFWFQWRAEPGVGGPNDNGDCINGKPVIEVLKQYYLSQ